MGCPNVCVNKQNQSLSAYTYFRQQMLLKSILSQFYNLNKCYSNDFVIKCHKKLIQNPETFILKYTKKIEQKQILPHIILQKWKLIVFGTNISNKNYISCLGFDTDFQEQRIIQDKVYKISENENPFQIRLQDLYFHSSYKQIQKDSIRAYHVPQVNQDLFEKVLKKIANHFPQTGYTLGINYIVGYFLLIGMSEIDSFWMFIHLALNQKFLILGLYERQFPLKQILIKIFRNVLKRKNRHLFQHLYNNIFVYDESYLFKCFLTFYLSIFPIQLCHFIWDYILTKGILGLVIFMVAFLDYIQMIVMKCSDVIQFGQRIKQYLSFDNIVKRNTVNIIKLMKQVYQLELEQEDFQNIIEERQIVPPYKHKPYNFYEKYFINYPKYKYKKCQQSKQNIQNALSQWYLSMIQKRQNFFQQEKTKIFTLTNNTFKAQINKKQQKQKQQSNQSQIKNVNDNKQIDENNHQIQKNLQSQPKDEYKQKLNINSENLIKDFNKAIIRYKIENQLQEEFHLSVQSISFSKQLKHVYSSNFFEQTQKHIKSRNSINYRHKLKRLSNIKNKQKKPFSVDDYLIQIKQKQQIQQLSIFLDDRQVKSQIIQIQKQVSYITLRESMHSFQPQMINTGMSFNQYNHIRSGKKNQKSKKVKQVQQLKFQQVKDTQTGFHFINVLQTNNSKISKSSPQIYNKHTQMILIKDQILQSKQIYQQKTVQQNSKKISTEQILKVQIIESIIKENQQKDLNNYGLNNYLTVSEQQIMNQIQQQQQKNIKQKCIESRKQTEQQKYDSQNLFQSKIQEIFNLKQQSIQNRQISTKIIEQIKIIKTQNQFNYIKDPNLIQEIIQQQPRIENIQ